MNGTISFSEERWDDDRTEENLTLFAISEESATDFNRSVQQLGGILTQMGRMMAAMQLRLDELESRERQVTLNHGEVKDLMRQIRLKADDFCEKYRLTDDASVKAVRSAIKKDVLKRYGVIDLHDVPAIARQAVVEQVARWSNIRLAMDRRAAAEP